EFKLDGTAQMALQQIEDKGYLIPYTADERQLISS
ncbi:PD-(D/E)XK nuclease domain-containing protein, partial [Bacteroides sp. 519]